MLGKQNYAKKLTCFNGLIRFAREIKAQRGYDSLLEREREAGASRLNQERDAGSIALEQAHREAAAREAKLEELSKAHRMSMVTKMVAGMLGKADLGTKKVEIKHDSCDYQVKLNSSSRIRLSNFVVFVF